MNSVKNLYSFGNEVQEETTRKKIIAHFKISKKDLTHMPEAMAMKC